MSQDIEPGGESQGVDLSTELPGASNIDLSTTELPGGGVTVRETDLEPGRDKVRAVLAIGLTVLLAIVTIGAVVAVWVDPALQEPIIEVLKVVFTPVVGLVGSAIGFYFGASGGRSSRS